MTAVVKRHRLDVMARATVRIVYASGPVVLCSHSICRTVAFAPANIAATITMTLAAIKSRATFCLPGHRRRGKTAARGQPRQT